MHVLREKLRQFRREIWRNYRKNGRDLPWRRTRDPYKILISEVMLQQTQVERVLGKYGLFLKRFPGFRALSRARLAEVLSVWHGLGYNRRALLLKRLAGKVMQDYRGRLPRDPILLSKLPGIGKATAGAISVFSFGKPVAFLETNTRRVFLHFFFPRRKGVGDDKILALADKALDRRNPREWYFALMDYGAMLGREKENPNRRSAVYRKQSAFKGSNRELRGKIIGLFVKKGSISLPALAEKLGGRDTRRLHAILSSLEKEGFLRYKGGRYRLL